MRVIAFSGLGIPSRGRASSPDSHGTKSSSPYGFTSRFAGWCGDAPRSSTRISPVGPGRGRKFARPGANGVVELTPFECLDRLADLVPPPQKHRHREHGVFAPNHKLRRAVTALAIGNIGKHRDAIHSL